MSSYHQRLQRFAGKSWHHRYLTGAYAQSLEEVRAVGPDPLGGAKPRVLLCGTGSAQTTAAFLAHLQRSHGNVSTIVLDLARAPLLASMAAGAQGLFIGADAHRLPLQDGSIDLIETDFFLQYFDAAGKRLVVGEWARVLSPNGAITTRDYVRSGRSLLDALLDRLRMAILWFFLGETFHATSVAELAATFSAHGLQLSLSPFRLRGWRLPLLRSLTARRARGPLS